MRVEAFDGAASEWDGFVREREGWTYAHLLGWRDVLGRVFRHECPYLCARDEETRLQGVLPLVRVRSALFGHYLVSMPFLNYGGPLGSPEAVRALAEEAAARARAEGVKLLELRSRRALPLSLPVSHRKIAVVLDLPGRSEDLWDDLPSKVRSQVRRPRKEGVELRFGPGEIDAFHAVFARHMRDLGTPALPPSFFRAVRETFGDDAWFGAAYLEGRPIAAGAGLRGDREVEMTWASALREHSRVAANMLLYWGFMERAIEEGLETFNFGRCTPDGGTHRFKRQWGGRDETLWWYQEGAGDASSTPSPDDPAYAWGPRVWRHLPLPIANFLGPRIVRHIP